jgi:fucose 4-O-acetylase-like acetyltransferase
MERNRFISFLQAFAIVLVVAGHLGDTESAVYGVINSWIYAFHMPLFMFISGFLMKYTAADADIEPRTFIGKKAVRLLAPYFVISTLVFPIKALLSRWAARPIEMSWADYFHQLIYPADNVVFYFWYLPTLFFIFVIAACALRWVGRDWVIAALMAVSLAARAFDWQPTELFNLTTVVRYLLWWGAGFYFQLSPPIHVRF